MTTVTREIEAQPRGQHAPNLGATIPGLKWGTVTSMTSKKNESLSVLHILVGGIPIPKNSYKWLVISYHDISYTGIYLITRIFRILEASI